MKDRSEKAFIRWIRDHLDRETENLDVHSVAGLRQARMAALATMERPGWRWWLPAGLLAAATATVLIVVMMQNEVPDTNFWLAGLEDADLLASEADLELLDDIDFYQWLEDTGYAG